MTFSGNLLNVSAHLGAFRQDLELRVFLCPRPWKENDSRPIRIAPGSKGRSAADLPAV
jgi:hypothetical protein